MNEGNWVAAVATGEANAQARYRALCEHGHADLTTRDIADEFDNAALHYRCDTDGKLPVAFLDVHERLSEPEIR